MKRINKKEEGLNINVMIILFVIVFLVFGFYITSIDLPGLINFRSGFNLDKKINEIGNTIGILGGWFFILYVLNNLAFDKKGDKK